jgi:hypothetical protein
MKPAKIIVRYANGRIIKGYTDDFLPAKSVFHIHPIDSNILNDIIKVSVQDLKGVFFVRDFEGDPNYREQNTFPDGVEVFGRKVEVRFKDGEVMIGSTLDYHPQRPGFFLLPSDPHWNTLRVFVVSQAVSKVYPI